MVIDKIYITINPANYKHYSQWFDDLKVKDKIEVTLDKLNKGSHTRIKFKCDECGIEKELKYKDYIKYGGEINGEWLCRMCKTKKSNIEKYGVEYTTQREDVKLKSLQTIQKKYGEDIINISQADDIKTKVIKTCEKKYGSKYYLSSEDCRKKIQSTLQNKYGKNNISQVEEIKSKIKSTRKSHGNINYSNIKNHYNVINHLNNKLKDYKIKYDIAGEVQIYCDNCQKYFIISHNLFNYRKSSNIDICTICNPVGVQYSNQENQVRRFIQENYFKEIIFGSKSIISPYQIDIYLPGLNLAIEYNGVYWHSDIFKNKDYHKIKADMCNKKQIRLLYIWEDEWKYNTIEIKNKLLNLINNSYEKLDKGEYIIERNSFFDVQNNYELIESYNPEFKWVDNDKRVDYETNKKIYNSGKLKINIKQ